MAHPIQIRRVGHVVLKVRSLARSVPFYRDVLGLKEVARLDDTAARAERPERAGPRPSRGEHLDGMAFFRATGENHHDVALLEVGVDAPPADHRAVGLYHVALKIGDGLDALRAAKAHRDRYGLKTKIANHEVSQSIDVNDSDGNGLELYVDADPAISRANPAAVAHVEPLEL